MWIKRLPFFQLHNSVMIEAGDTKIETQSPPLDPPARGGAYSTWYNKKNKGKIYAHYFAIGDNIQQVG